LSGLGADEARSPLLRVKALAGQTSRAGRLDDSAFDLLMSQLSPDLPASDRGEAARMFANARLSTAQLIKLCGAVSQAGPLELPILINAYYKSRDAKVGNSFVLAVGKAPGIGNVPPAEIKRMLTRYPTEVLEEAGELLDRLLKQRAEQAQRLAAMEAEMKDGDARRGEAVFHAQKTLCAVCHRVGNKGGQVGPDLSRIGRIRTTRDLLESIVYPSSSIARDFESYSVDTKDGETHVGVILRESDDELQIAVASGQPMRLARKFVSEVRANPLSLMPQGLDQAMSRKELADLIAYLKSLK